MHSSPLGLRYRCSASLFVARQQPASAAGCSRCSKPAFASSCFCGTATGRIRSRLLAWQQPAFAFSCISAHPCKRCTPALSGFVTAAVLRCSWHGNSLHPQPVALMARQQAAFAAGCSRCSKPAFAASCILLIPASDALQPFRPSLPLQCFAVRGTAIACSRSRWFPVQQVCIRIQLHAAQQLPGAALRPPGSICAAMLSLLPAPARIRTQLHLALDGVIDGCLALLIGTFGGKSGGMANAQCWSDISAWRCSRAEEHWSDNQPFTIHGTRFCCEVTGSFVFHGEYR